MFELNLERSTRSEDKKICCRIAEFCEVAEVLGDGLLSRIVDYIFETRIRSMRFIARRCVGHLRSAVVLQVRIEVS